MTQHKRDKQPKPMRYPRLHIFAVAVCSTLMVLALTLLPTPDATATKTLKLEQPRIVQDDPSFFAPSEQENANQLTEAEVEPQQPTRAWQAQVVKKGDTLSHLFKRMDLSAKDVHKVMQGDGDVKSLLKIHPGQTLNFHIEDNQLKALQYIQSRTETLLVELDGDKYVASKQTKELIPYTSYAEGSIESSLFLAAKKAGLSENLTMELAGIFGWDVDFALDIRSGDSFKVIYQELHLDGEKIKDGEILAAQFTNKGETFTAIRYETSDRGSSYFTPKGNSMRKAFLRSPIHFARISSHFNLRRKHPVLHTIRAHKGTDYAASRGTAIKATGDGKVVFAGRKGGYGKVVIIQHGQSYKTLYAHMHNYGKGIRSGKRVKQGQVIGYVGSTGLATGPHLHYEFYVNGAVRNPVTVKLPHARPIAKQDKDDFLALAEQMENQLTTYGAALKGETVASNP